jgi:L-fuculose-phosphate aldolase
MYEAQIRKNMVRYSQMLHTNGWVANHDGNLSARLDPQRLICTPTAWSKGDVTLDDLLSVDENGQKTAGRHRAFSELKLHLAVYRLRSDVQAVIHAHSPYATAFGAAQKAIPHPFLPEAVVSLGSQIPLVPLTNPGQDAVDALAPWIRQCDAVTISGNGVLAWGPTLELAYLRLELVEHLAKIAHQAVALGGVHRLPSTMIDALVAKRHKGGLSCPEEPGIPTSTLDPLIEKASQRIQTVLPHISSSQIQNLATQALKEVRRT